MYNLHLRFHMQTSFRFSIAFNALDAFSVVPKRFKTHQEPFLTIYTCIWCISKIFRIFANLELYISGLGSSGRCSKTHKRRRGPDQTVRLTCRFRFCSRLPNLMVKTFPIFENTTKILSSGCLAFRAYFPRFRTCFVENPDIN